MYSWQIFSFQLDKSLGHSLQLYDIFCSIFRYELLFHTLFVCECALHLLYISHKNFYTKTFLASYYIK